MGLHPVRWEETMDVWELSLDFSPPHLVKHRILDAEGLALGAIIASSKKSKRDLIDNSFNR